MPPRDLRRIQTPYDWPTAKSIIDRSPEVPYDYMTLTVSRHKTERREYALASLGREPLQRFENARGDAVLVFRLR